MSANAYKRTHLLAGHMSASAAAGAGAGACAAAASVAPHATAGSSASATRAGLLVDHVSIITGSGQGIGEATAKLFAAEGSKVVVTDIDAAKSDTVAAAINAAHGSGTALSVPGDVTDKAFPENIVSATIKAFGKLNVLVNNAGYTWDAMAHKTSDEQFEAMLLVHNTAPFRLCRAAAPYLRDASKAEAEAGSKPQNRCIINISSTSGIHGNVGQANYATAKAGINGLTKTLAKEWGPFGVRTNSIAFGFVETRLTQAKELGAFQQIGNKKIALGIPGGGAKRDYSAIPLRRAATPLEAAGAVLALASPLSAYITGHVLEVTGGAGI